MELDKEKKVIFDKIKNNPHQNYFIQGGAGTGKSTLINYIREHLNRRLAIVAPTGIAAELINGVTIHSLFKLGGKPYFPRELVNRYQQYDHIVKIIDTLIIDEVSMLRADILDTINILCQKAKENHKIFGGIQVILVGDLYQLPPVYKYETKPQNSYKTNEEIINAKDYMEKTYNNLYPFFFDAKCYKDANFSTQKLTVSYRQSDPELLNNLNIIRQGDKEQIDNALKYFNDCNDSCTDVPIVTSTRIAAQQKNEKELQNIKEPEQIFTGKFEGEYYTESNGNPQLLEQRKSDVQIPEILRLKKTAKVMLCKNNPQEEYINGTIGEITDFVSYSKNSCPEIIKVKLQNTNREVEIRKATWEVQEYVKNANSNNLELRTIGSYTQFPLKLAYAITIHKSQGQTWDGICIDLGENEAFADGQVYVALSRVKSKAGIHLKRKITPNDIRVNPRIIQFLEGSENFQSNIEEPTYTPEGNSDAKKFWQKYFPQINDNNFNYASKGTNSNHRNAFWATLPNSRLEADWYIACTDKLKKIAKLFFIPANKFNPKQFSIDKTAQRKSKILPNINEKFEICIMDSDIENYAEKINNKVCFGNCLCATADYGNNTIKVDIRQENNDG